MRISLKNVVLLKHDPLHVLNYLLFYTLTFNSYQFKGGFVCNSLSAAMWFYFENERSWRLFRIEKISVARMILVPGVCLIDDESGEGLINCIHCIILRIISPIAQYSSSTIVLGLS